MLEHWRSCRTFLGVTLTVAVIATTATLGGQKSEPAASGSYPKPRSPASPTTARTVDELMPYARAAARNKSNILGQGFGVVNAGETILLVPTVRSEEMVVEAVKRALEERKIKVVLVPDYELVGVTREQAAALDKATESKTTAEHGYLEAAWWLTTFPNGAGAKWLKERRPDLIEKMFPPSTTQQLPKELQAVRAKMGGAFGGAGSPIVEATKGYLLKHPDIRGVFFGKGGPIWMWFHPIEHRWLGAFTQDDRLGLVNDTVHYPADVWMLTEELSMEPLAYVDKVHVTDPEGTDASWSMTVEQAQKWAKGVYLRGHLFLFPQEAYGQYALSVIDYPAMQKDWISPEPMVLLDGVVAGTNGHGGFFPRIEERFKNGYLAEVKGGGLYGDVLREFMKHPKMNTVTYPHFKHPGYFYHFETALGTNPKVRRDPLNRFFSVGAERMRSGVFHWGLGQNLWNDPGSQGGASADTDTFAAEQGVSGGHGFHIHTYFTTYRVHLRNTEKWITITDRGRLTALDNPEVRALASRYGNADEILREEWIPEVPGINVPGKYETDYALDPYKYAKSVEDKIVAGTYPFLTAASKSSR